MGKGTDKLYITHSEWSSSDAYSASAGSNVSQKATNGANFKRLPFNFCAASLQPFKHPVCTPEGTIFDVEVVTQWLEKHGTNPVTGKPLKDKDLIRLNFARNGDTDAHDGGGGAGEGKGEMVDPVTFKVFTDNTHIVAIRHGSEANVFAWETVERLNIKPKMWLDLVDNRKFGRSNIITLQDPQNIESRDLSQFKFLKDGETVLTKEQEAERQKGSVNIDALGRVGEKVLRAKEAVEKARKEREAGGDINRSKIVTKTGPTNSAPSMSLIQEKKTAYNAAQYTTGKAAASFTSTGLTPETSGERALLTDEEYMLRPKRVKIKGYARIETNFGSLNIELQTETAPRAVWNFVHLAKKGYYNRVKFHRNIRNFMIQGGDPTGTGKGGTSIWGKNFQDEFDGPLTHDSRGVMSMANKGKNTNSSQFFITYKPAKHLDRKHTIFGRVVGGMDVLQKLENVPTNEANRPEEDIIMENVVVFVDPFEEFQKQKREKDELEKVREEVKKQGGTEDDKTTWTGKRIRGDGSVVQAEQTGGVGKYLKSGADSSNGKYVGDDEMLEAEPVRKKIKPGGFGNFDSW
ncbi:peptidyl-prolyl cis-trans isomeras-like protein-like 2 [Hyaloscypha bicolor E]|uniref:Peptidyl-prolyl cis-trans isomerase-like 2 n=1 Tax=Hyaloscypha bicolor E TaxID=1095630 RepID=A0A2J6T7P5_9HELO|nr:peptidyl-prolyl cis-trans isomeras-like protein-like 2 [Hyaloscypha bicolor E]PMD59049.1 peptidyl-prolyl cis-trans isomeras-like protein-like 2 [Hyaloscypha bicolor E]